MKIETKVPAPPHNTRSKLSASLLTMNPGDSFVVLRRDRERVFAAANYYGIKVMTRSVGNGRLRVWKIDPNRNRNNKQKEQKNDNTEKK